jgi:hypothetical protein
MSEFVPESKTNDKQIWIIAHSLETDMQYSTEWFKGGRETKMPPQMMRMILEKIMHDMTEIKRLAYEDIKIEEGIS